MIDDWLDYYYSNEWMEKYVMIGSFQWLVSYLYPYSMLSPHPPQIHSWLRFLGRRAREQPQDESWPSRQAREIEWTTPAAAIEWANAASRLPVFCFLFWFGLGRGEFKFKLWFVIIIIILFRPMKKKKKCIQFKKCNQIQSTFSIPFRVCMSFNKPQIEKEKQSRRSVHM